jgi:hypothetical protein
MDERVMRRDAMQRASVPCDLACVLGLVYLNLALVLLFVVCALHRSCPRPAPPPPDTAPPPSDNTNA